MPIQKLLCSLAILLITSLGSHAVMIVDTAPVGSLNGTNNTAEATYADAYTVAETGNNNLLVIAYTARGNGATPTPISATFGSVSLNIVGTQTTVDGATFRAVTSFFYLTQAQFGGDFTTTAQDLVITRDGADDGVEIAFFTLSGVNQTSPVGDVQTNGNVDDNTELQVTLNGLGNGSLIASAFSGSYRQSVSIGSNIDTVLFGPTSTNNLRSAGGLTDVTGASETLGYTYNSTSGRAALSAVEFVAVPEPGAGLLLLLGAAAFLTQRRRRA